LKKRKYDGKTQNPGMEPYTPTKLEWLALRLNIDSIPYDIEEDGFFLNFTHNYNDAIIIFVGHSSTVDREVMNDAVEFARSRVDTATVTLEWPWLRIEEKYKKTR